MKTSTREQRRQAIEDAAISLLEEVGYDGMSMLGVAKRARASNETLYRWYGDKKGLFKALVEHNARLIEDKLRNSLAADASPIDGLRTFGAALLGVLLGNRAIALNRAAAADASGELGATLAREGRDTVLALLKTVMADAQGEGFLSSFDPDAAIQLYLSLLIGDLQIRCVTQALPPLPDEAIQERAEWAWSMLQQFSDHQPPSEKPPA